MLEMLAIMFGLSVLIFLISKLFNRPDDTLFVDELTGSFLLPSTLALYIMMHEPCVVGRNEKWFSVVKENGYYICKQVAGGRATCTSCDRNVIANFIIHHSV